MEFTLDPKVVEVINDYMGQRKIISPKGLEGICSNELKDMADKVLMEKSIKSLVRLRTDECVRSEEIHIDKFKSYFDGDIWYRRTWQWKRSGYGYLYFLRGKCERYFERNSERFILNFLSETYGDIETAVQNTECFVELWNEFEKWFDERRNKFMEKMEIDIQKVREMSKKKTPQSHGGVANLLKVLTKTMEKQGADITNIAKVQYAVCVQAGIYIPDEFIRDVAVTLDMKEIEQLKENVADEKP